MAMKFGSVLRAVRERAGFTQEEFAHRMNMSPSCVSKIENDRKVPNGYTLVDWIKETNSQEVAVAFFFGMDGLAAMAQLVTQVPLFVNFFTLFM